jgi:hypothetical protein
MHYTVTDMILKIPFKLVSQNAVFMFFAYFFPFHFLLGSPAFAGFNFLVR